MTFVHHRALKDYDRAAAGEKMPLPSELRTDSALHATMNFLISEVMDSDVGSMDEWYEFIWNRSRSIRKEINQRRMHSSLAARYLKGMLKSNLSGFDRIVNY